MEGAGEASEGAERAKEVAGGKGGGSVAAVESQGGARKYSGVAERVGREEVKKAVKGPEGT